MQETNAVNLQQAYNEQRKLRSKYTTARHNLLIVVVMTVINIILLLTNSGSYFLFSATLPYYIVTLGMIYSGKFAPEFYGDDYYTFDFYGNGFLIATVIIAAIFVTFYVLSWLLSKKRPNWLVFALVFIVLDLIGMFVFFGISSDMLVDIIFHGWIIYYLASGVTANRKLKSLPELPEVPEVLGEPMAVAAPEFSDENATEPNSAETVEAPNEGSDEGSNQD